MKLNNLIQSSYDTDASTDKLREIKNRKKKPYGFIKREKSKIGNEEKNEIRRYFREMVLDYIRQMKGTTK